MRAASSREVPSGTFTADADWRRFPAREMPVTPRLHEFEEVDGGRLHVDRRFRELLAHNGISTFEGLFDVRGGLCVRRIKYRWTIRIARYDGSGHRWFHLKRHVRPRWVEQLRPLLNFGRPVFGARNEWLAIRSP